MSRSSDSHGRLTRLVLCALLAALSILLGKYLAINVGDFIRISFENLPILLAGLYLGPLSGAAVGAVADLVGCLLVGYSINPIITLGAVLIGLLSGLVGMGKRLSLPRLLLAVGLSHLMGSILVKTVGLFLFLDTPFWLTLGWRSLTYLLVWMAECAVLWALSHSKTLTSELTRLRPTKAGKL